MSESNVSVKEARLAATGRDAVAVWTQSYNASTNIMSARVRVGEAWSKPERISDGMSPARTPSVASDATGRVLAAWEQDMPDGVAVFARLYSPETGWSPPKQLGSSVAMGTFPTAILEPGGNGFVFWVGDQVERNGGTVHGERFIAGAGWRGLGIGDLYVPARMAGGAVRQLEADIDDSGRAVLAWTDSAGIRIARFE